MIGDSIGEGVQARKQLKASKDAVKDAKSDRERALWMASQGDYTPEYAADHIGPYQRAEAPIADAFLNSFLTGDNAAAVPGTRPGARAQQAQAQARSDSRFGTMDQLLAREKQVQAATPWAIKPFTREISKPDYSEEAYNASKLPYLTREQADALSQAGFEFKDGRFREKGSNKEVRNLMHDLGLDTDTKGGQGQAVLAGLADRIAAGATVEDIKAELAAPPRRPGVWVGETRDAQTAYADRMQTGEDQRKADFLTRYGAAPSKPKKG